ncbi:serine/threonine-protein kinase [Nocardioides sp. MAHUQ-72]|uniref:serine/threonine-protein kinase n=1 Tax=unclassified Nocardioides TaxID=2615069 RepID=UPI00360CFF5E
MTSEPVLAERYQLEEVIGRGGMAEVHRATDRVLHRPVAVKVLRDTADDETDRHRFTAEAHTLARLSHPGLVMVLDAGTTAERPYLVMELVEGRTLAQCCAGRRLDPARVAAIGGQLADALAYAHAEGVVHRDVKPGNVLVTEDDRVKLADFGIARLIGDTVRHTRTGHAIGTAAYLAPEQVQGEEITTAVDVYSLGLVLLESLTGERAFPGSPTESALARLQREPVVPTWLPEAWQRLLAAMTAREPGRRPGAADVARELHLIVADPAGTTLPLSAPVPRAAPAATPATRAPRRDVLAGARAAAARVPRHQWGVIGAGAAMVLLLAAAALASGGGSGSTPDRLPAQTPPRLEQPLQDLHDAVGGGGQ